MNKYRDKMVLLIDTMNNDFIDSTGTWPEGYMLLDRSGTCYKKTAFTKNGRNQLEDLERIMNDEIEGNKPKVKPEIPEK